MSPPPILRVTALYPDRLNLYGDRGNLLVLTRRAERRGATVDLTSVHLGDDLPDHSDLIYIGGGQDRDQARCALDLQRHRSALVQAAAEGTVVLGICGGYQLLGNSYETSNGTIPGIGLLDVDTVAGEGPRLVGDAVVERPDGTRLVGFENHQGRTTLGPGVRPLGVVVAGHGNNGEDGTEGAADGAVIGTYLHGPLLAKNADLADHLLELAWRRPLTPLIDRFERSVHEGAISRALERGRRAEH